ncbi:MAG TPA: hypothetical protein VFD63_07300 [Pyrinomonadaceae bacterium]|jgi:hypothetical protein|nr:hypothetical protein [Pyrinomonadaceae bacterium]
MNGKAAGGALPIVFGGYMLFSHISESKLFQSNSKAEYATAMSLFGAFLLILGLIFFLKNLK